MTKDDPSDGDYDPIARYEQGAMIVAVIFAAGFFALIVWLGWMIFITSNYRGCRRSGGRDSLP